MSSGADHPAVAEMDEVQVDSYPATHNSRPPPKRVLSDIPEPITKSGSSGAATNLVNAIVGSGIIGIPFMIRESGLVVGLLLLLLVSYLAGEQ